MSKIDFSKHPCFNDKARHTYGRVHLPVAPKCNVQCNFCNRKYDCVNESRPGVTSSILSPKQALFYLDEIVSEKNITVVGIAGPGDPFANPAQTMETMRLVREKYPEMLLCVASNGLNVFPYLDELAELKVSHVTITVNAVDPAIGAEIYSWIRPDKRPFRGTSGAELLLENQLKAIKGLKERGIMVKINSIVIPGINEDHIGEVARTVSELGADILNCLPYFKTEGALFEHLDEPPKEVINRIRKETSALMPQMHHCTRCRADAVGLLSEGTGEKYMNRLMEIEKMPLDPFADKKFVAVASMEGVLINEHLGRAKSFYIYGKTAEGTMELVDTRQAPPPGSGDARWDELAGLFSDCQAVLVSSAGQKPVNLLQKQDVKVIVLEGLISTAVTPLLNGESIDHLTRAACACSGCGGESEPASSCSSGSEHAFAGCSGGGEGCG